MGVKCLFFNSEKRLVIYVVVQLNLNLKIMKKVLFIALSLIVFSMTSCKKENCSGGYYDGYSCSEVYGHTCDHPIFCGMNKMQLSFSY